MNDREPIQAPLEKATKAVAEPFQSFAGAQTSSGWVLLACTTTAIVLANSPLASWYLDLIHTELSLTLGGAGLRMSLQHWVNDGLMAMFFFLLGLELKKELLVGQLRDPLRATSVMFAAAGGMLMPALLFLATAESEAASDGWGIPIATDTAFALVVLVLLGKRVPAAARAFLVGLAIVDDLGAILVIALAYTAELNIALLWPVTVCTLLLVSLNLIGVRNGFYYVPLGLILWWLFLELGVHGTLTGVVVALTAPVRPAISRNAFLSRIRKRLRQFEQQHDEGTRTILEQSEQQEIAEDVARLGERASAPLRRWETRLEKPIGFIVMPLFAFMNAGVSLSGSAIAAAWQNDLNLAIILGLLIGKPIGVLGGVWIGKLIKLAELPEALSWRHIFGIGLLGSIGFTMSLFIATLSFAARPDLLDIAKLSVIGTSVCAALLGYAWLRWACRGAS